MDIVVLPSKYSALPNGLRLPHQHDVVYAEDWFSFQAFDEAFEIMEDFESTLRRSLPSWFIRKCSIWSLAKFHLFAMSLGNLKHLLPFAARLSELLDQETSRVTLVWPVDDLFTQIAQSIAKHKNMSASLHIHLSKDVSNPTPVEFLGDSYPRPRLSAWPLLYLALLHILVCIGKALPGKADLAGKHVIYADLSNREITSQLRHSKKIAVSSLPPKLLYPIRELMAGRLANAMRLFQRSIVGASPAAEDILLLGLKRSAQLYGRFLTLYRTRYVMTDLLLLHLASRGLPYLPSDYLRSVIDDLFHNRSFIKFLFYLILIDRHAEFRSLTSVTGGMTKSLLLELGRATGKDVFDLNHTVLMLDPSEVRNRADRIAVKGHPDLDRLRQNVPDERLYLTGRPYFDRLYRFAQNGSEPSKLNLPPEMKSWQRPITIATEPIRDHHIIRVLEQAFKATGPDGVCIKLHPKEHLARYRSLMNEINNHGKAFVLVHSEYPLFDLLKASKAVVHISSNVGLESLAMGIPALHVDVPCNVRLYYQTTRHFRRFSTTLEMLPRKIDLLMKRQLNAPEVQAIRGLYLIDGRASQRVLSTIFH